MKLYHYTKFDTLIYGILPKMQLKFFPFSGSNDPFEFLRLFQIDLSNFSLQYREEIVTEYFNHMNKYKFICFSKDGANFSGFRLPTMWAFYGENHNGVCLEIELDKLDFSVYKKGSIIKGSVKYGVTNSESKVILGNPKSKENAIEFIQRSISQNIKKWESSNLFTKLKDWKIENEYRIVKKLGEDNDLLDISNAITSIYLGVRSSSNKQDSPKLKILELLIDDINKLREEKIQLNIMYNDNENNKPMIDCYNWQIYKVASNHNREIGRKMKQKIQSDES